MTRNIQRCRALQMKAFSVKCVFCLCLFAAPFPCRLVAASAHHHQGKKDFRREVEQLEEQWRTAQLTGDVQAMDKLLSDDYVGISMTGQVNTKTQQLDRLRNRTLVLTAITLSDVKVKLFGSIAIVTSLAEVDGTNDGATMKGLYRYTRVYQRLPSGVWKITNFEATRVPRSQNDQAFQRSGDIVERVSSCYLDRTGFGIRNQ